MTYSCWSNKPLRRQLLQKRLRILQIARVEAFGKPAVVHVTENFGPNFSKEFMALAKPERFVVYTVAPTDELKKTLADFHPIYMTPFDGFTR